VLQEKQGHKKNADQIKKLKKRKKRKLKRHIPQKSVEYQMLFWKYGTLFIQPKTPKISKRGQSVRKVFGKVPRKSEIVEIH